MPFVYVSATHSAVLIPVVCLFLSLCCRFLFFVYFLSFKEKQRLVKEEPGHQRRFAQSLFAASLSLFSPHSFGPGTRCILKARLWSCAFHKSMAYSTIHNAKVSVAAAAGGVLYRAKSVAIEECRGIQ